MDTLIGDIAKLALAVLLGGVLGFERELKDKAAGFRTLTLICLGSTLFTMLSIKLGGALEGTRIAANIVTGVGFLGAGAIFHDDNRVTGLTTAALVWAAAAIGMGVGGNHPVLATAVAGMILLIMLLFRNLDGLIDRFRDTRTYEVAGQHSIDLRSNLERVAGEHNLVVRHAARSRVGERVRCRLTLSGSPADHERFVAEMLARPDMLEFHS